MLQNPQNGSVSSIESAQSFPDKMLQNGEHDLPSLPMNLHQKKKSIAITWALLIFMTCILDEILYFVLRYGAKTSTDTALTVPTAVLAVFSVLTIGFRTSQLIRKSLNRRPAGGLWWQVTHSDLQVLDRILTLN